MKKKINFKLILIQSISLFFLINGVKRLFLGTQADLYHAIIVNDYDKLGMLTDLTPGEILVSQMWWALGSFIAGIIIIGLINFRFKASIFNSMATFLIILSLFPLGIFHDGLVHLLLNSVGYLFSDEMGVAFFIGGGILCLISLLLLYVSLINAYRKEKILN